MKVILICCILVTLTCCQNSPKKIIIKPEQIEMFNYITSNLSKEVLGRHDCGMFITINKDENEIFLRRSENGNVQYLYVDTIGCFKKGVIVNKKYTDIMIDPSLSATEKFINDLKENFEKSLTLAIQKQKIDSIAKKKKQIYEESKLLTEKIP